MRHNHSAFLFSLPDESEASPDEELVVVGTVSSEALPPVLPVSKMDCSLELPLRPGDDVFDDCIGGTARWF